MGLAQLSRIAYSISMPDKQIPLTRGMFATVDEADYEELAKFKWHTARYVNRAGTVYDYARRNVKVRPGRPPKGKQVGVLMHVQLMNPPPGFRVDHIEPAGTLDNRRSNLRVVTHAQNIMNSRKAKGCVSRFKGVHRSTGKYRKEWTAMIVIGGKKKQLGYFADEIDAAQAYNFAAEEYFGEYARMNLPL